MCRTESLGSVCAPAATHPTPHLTRLSDAHQSSAPHRYHRIPAKMDKVRLNTQQGKGTPSQTLTTDLPLYRKPLNELSQHDGGRTIVSNCHQTYHASLPLRSSRTSSTLASGHHPHHLLH
jgi:hypothetical protein